MNVLMIYPKSPEQTPWNVSDSARFVLSRHGILPPLGLLTIASYLPEDFQIRLIDRNLNKESSEDWKWADVIFLSLMLAQRKDYENCVALARIYKKPIAVGGPFTHSHPEIAIADADWVCFGEAEDILEQLTADIRADRRKRSYQGGNKTNMELVRAPRFDLLPHINDYCGIGLPPCRYPSDGLGSAGKEGRHEASTI